MADTHSAGAAVEDVIHRDKIHLALHFAPTPSHAAPPWTAQGEGVDFLAVYSSRYFAVEASFQRWMSSKQYSGRMSMSESVNMGLGHFFSHSTASSIERTCHIQ